MKITITLEVEDSSRTATLTPEVVDNVNRLVAEAKSLKTNPSYPVFEYNQTTDGWFVSYEYDAIEIYMEGDGEMPKDVSILDAPKKRCYSPD